MSKVVKVLYLEDTDSYIMKLPSGTYELDGKIFEIKCKYNEYEDIEVKSLNELKRCDVRSVLDKYYNSKEDKYYTIEEYEKKIDELLVGSIDDGHGTISFGGDLDAEFKYRIFKQETTALHKDIVNYYGVITTEVFQSKIDTGCEYIKPILNLCEVNKNSIFTYDRKSANKDIVHKVFNELGYNYVDKPRFEDVDTTEDKIWINSNHAYFKYVQAFGGYVFNDDNQPRATQYNGTLEDCIEEYNKDVERITETILLKYNLNKYTQEELGIDLKDLLNSLDIISSYVYDLDVKVKDETKHRHLVNKLFNTKDLLKKTIIKKGKELDNE